jgi:gamma-glutamylcyclotransferase
MAGKQAYFPRRRVRKITDTGTRKWIINTRGVATIIPSPNDFVWGIVLLLHAHDEQKLDDDEGHNYVKSILPVQAVGMKLANPSVLIYIDKNTTPGRPRPAYVKKLEKAMEDGKKKGIPQSYFDTYWEPFLANPFVGSEAGEAELEE